MADKNFDYLGGTFQQQLINQIIIDKNFSHSILDVLEANYFENKYYKIMTGTWCDTVDSIMTNHDWPVV
jgi:hypothetical protein